MSCKSVDGLTSLQSPHSLMGIFDDYFTGTLSSACWNWELILSLKPIALPVFPYLVNGIPVGPSAPLSIHMKFLVEM